MHLICGLYSTHTQRLFFVWNPQISFRHFSSITLLERWKWNNFLNKISKLQATKNKTGCISDFHPEGKCHQGLVRYAHNVSFPAARLNCSYPLPGTSCYIGSQAGSYLWDIIKFPNINRIPRRCQKGPGEPSPFSGAFISRANRQIQREEQRPKVDQEPRPGWSSAKETAQYQSCCPKEHFVISHVRNSSHFWELVYIQEMNISPEGPAHISPI